MESTSTDKGEEFTELKETEEERKIRTKVRLKHSARLQPCSGRGGGCLLKLLILKLMSQELGVRSGKDWIQELGVRGCT